MKKEDIIRTEIIQAPAQQQDEDVIDIRGLLMTVWRGKWIIAICMLIASALAVMAISQLEARYKASASVMFDLQKTNVVNLQEVLVDQEFSKDTLQNQIEILRSTNLVNRVVEKLRLDRNPEFNPRLRVKEETALDRLRNVVAIPPEITDLLQNLGIVSPPPPPVDAERAARNELLEVIQNVKNGMSLAPVRGSRVIQISFTSANPVTASRIVNAMADQYIVDQLESKLEAARAATAWLSSRVQDLEEQVKISEEKVESVKTQLSLDAGQSLAITNQQLEALNATLAVARSDVSQVSSQYERLSSALDQGQDLGAIPEFRDSSLIQSYRQQQSALLARQISLRDSVSEDHPTRVALRSQLEELQRNMTEEAKRVVTSVEIQLASLRTREIRLVEQVRELESLALNQSRDGVQLRQLEREAQASRSLYENFLTRLQETNVQQDLQSADARVISPAEPPTRAQSQRKNLILITGLLLGSLLGLAVVFLLDRLNNTFRSPQQLGEVLKQTVLGVIPAAGRRMKRSSIVQHLRDRPSSSLAESIRNLRTSILYSDVDNPPRVIMFTSSVPREGKSTTSMLTALTSRQMGKSAIIVDCDLRMPALSKLLETDDEAPGLLSLLDGSATINDVIHKDPDTGLHVLMTRNSERQAQINAADILASQKFRDLVKALSEHYDLVILDTPPTLVVTDARIVSHLADAVVYVVRWDSTPRDAVMEGLKELTSVDADITGVVMTQVNEQRASSYAYDGYSYYKGQYRDYYDIG